MRIVQRVAARLDSGRAIAASRPQRLTALLRGQIWVWGRKRRSRKDEEDIIAAWPGLEGRTDEESLKVAHCRTDTVFENVSTVTTQWHQVGDASGGRCDPALIRSAKTCSVTFSHCPVYSCTNGLQWLPSLNILPPLLAINQ